VGGVSVGGTLVGVSVGGARVGVSVGGTLVGLAVGGTLVGGRVVGRRSSVVGRRSSVVGVGELITVGSAQKQSRNASRINQGTRRIGTPLQGGM
jgi:hypothetical protein